jgi:acyl-CoA synthetase (AMP-forming)/AMP-acid ligase II/pimeloyl-ACP methyl ester carboxylesterase
MKDVKSAVAGKVRLSFGVVPQQASPEWAERWQSLLSGRNIPLNLGDEFASIAASQPDVPAIITTKHGKVRHSYETLTFAEVQERAAQYAAGMRQYGIQRGSTALVLVKPMPDFVPAFLALFKVGAVPVALDRGPSRKQTLRSIEQIGPKVLIGIPVAHALRIFYPKTFRSVTHPVTAGRSVLIGGPTLESWRGLPNDADSGTSTMAEDELAIIFTTGSTGPPKGVAYQQKNAAAIVQIVKEALGVGRGEVCLACYPAFAMHFIGAGATVVMPDMDPRFPANADPKCLLEIIRDQKPATAFMQIPVIRNLQKYCEDRGEKIPHLRKILTTGASVSVDMVRAVHRVLAEPDGDLHIMYGATEALCVSFATGRELLAREEAMNDGRGTYLGRSPESVTVKVIHIQDEPIEQWDESMIVSQGEIGELCVSGPVVTPEYRNQPEATNKAKIKGGNGLWHRMGDAGYLDPNGGIWYCGRITHRVPVEDGHLYPDLIEPIFNRHPAVRRSALVGVPIPGSKFKRPVVVVEPNEPDHGDWDQLQIELQAIASSSTVARMIKTVLVHKEPFPVDIRHNAKILREQLVAYAAEHAQMPVEFESSGNHVMFKGHRVAYFEKGHGDAILFLHNAGNDHLIWQYQFEHFARSHRVIAVDSLGYGQSASPNVEYSLPLYTEMVAAIVNALHLAPVTIIATCTGAAMALNFTLENPEKVKQLFLFHLATYHTVAGGNLHRTAKMFNGRRGFARLLTPWVSSWMQRGGLHRAMIDGQYADPSKEDPKFLEHMHSLYSRKREASSLLRLFSNWSSFRPLDELRYRPDLPPLHMFWGSKNNVLKLDRGRELSERLNPTTFDVIDGAGHLAMREKPDEVTRRIEQLMR